MKKIKSNHDLPVSALVTEAFYHSFLNTLKSIYNFNDTQGHVNLCRLFLTEVFFFFFLTRSGNREHSTEAHTSQM